MLYMVEVVALHVKLIKLIQLEAYIGCLPLEQSLVCQSERERERVLLLFYFQPHVQEI